MAKLKPYYNVLWPPAVGSLMIAMAIKGQAVGPGIGGGFLCGAWMAAVLIALKTEDD